MSKQKGKNLTNVVGITLLIWCDTCMVKQKRLVCSVFIFNFNLLIILSFHVTLSLHIYHQADVLKHDEKYGEVMQNNIKIMMSHHVHIIILNHSANN